ncbi:MAG: cobyrinate a,c-diamide synthase [Thermodesulfobacteriota bacterium]|nr:cobyrinate a,c-diamide synthase [Thermodesulfobacteriota bacterium]
MKQISLLQKNIDNPGLVIAALRGGSGKTIFSVGIISALKNLGQTIAPFKKGPDYIDAGWLGLAAGRPCYNLDTFLIEKEAVLYSFLSHTFPDDIAVIEGNRGLYDGIDLEGTTSTAELAKLLNLPVILCINATKTTRTMAAVVSGCIQFDPGVKIKGVILNRVAGLRHETILRKSIEHFCGVPVLGAVPKLGDQNFPERHMGLVPTPEHHWAKKSIEAISQVALKYLDLDYIKKIAGKPKQDGIKEPPKVRTAEESVPPPNINVRHEGYEQQNQKSGKSHPSPTIGIIKDSAFQFYYPDNFEALGLKGAKLVFISPLGNKTIPSIDALYIGGGFPETHAERLAENKEFKKQLKAMADNGLPIYAECGGLMYLGEELVLKEKSYPMVGIFPVSYSFSKKPKGHGYTVVSVVRENPYFEIGSEIKGHEFHYSSVLKWGGKESDLAFSIRRGTGFINQKDGICYKNVLATYIHIHALGTPSWAEAMVRNAIQYKELMAKTPNQEDTK